MLRIELTPVGVEVTGRPDRLYVTTACMSSLNTSAAAWMTIADSTSLHLIFKSIYGNHYSTIHYMGKVKQLICHTNMSEWSTNCNNVMNNNPKSIRRTS